MFYGCRYGVVKKYNLLMSYDEIRFFWISLPTTKCNGFPFAHIYEWKRNSPSSVSFGSSGWIFEVLSVLVGSTSMIYLFLLNFETESDSELGSISLSSATNDYFEQHSSVLCQGILWKLHRFPMFLFSSCFSSYLMD
jgi:hypothetical protein